MVKRTLFAVFVLVALLLSAALAPAVAQAAGNPPPDHRADPGGTYQEIFAQYDLRPVESIPQGVSPFRVESPAELSALMEKLATPAASDAGLVEIAAFNSPYCVAINWGTGQSRVYADVDISSGYVTRLYGVRNALVGASLGFSLTEYLGVLHFKGSF